MSSAAMGPRGAPALPMEPRVAPDRGSRSFVQQAIRDTFSRTGAMLGSIWVVIMLSVAALAPLIANTRPWLYHNSTGYHFPLLTELTPIDIILLLLAGLVLALYVFKSLRSGKTLLIVLSALVAATVIIALAVHPRREGDWEKYRRMARTGEMTSVVHTLIPYSPQDRNTDAPVGEHPAAPSRKHWLGTERNGADLLSQMLHATRIAVSIGFVSTAIAVLIGVTLGAVMGYCGGWVDLLGMRFIEIVDAIPRLIMLLAVAALIGNNLFLLMSVIGLLGWTGHARFVRAEFLKLRNQDFVHAAVAAGLPTRSILFRHILANGITPVLISASFGIATAILIESVLSFLGLGDPDRPSWGQLLNQARSGGANFNWWIAVFPGVAIFFTVFSYNLIGEAMRDALDPKFRKRD